MVLVVSVVLGVGGREARERGRGRSGEGEARERERERGRGMADASGAVVSREELLSRQREEIRSHQQLAEGLGKVRPHKIECADGEEKEKSVLGAESVFLTQSMKKRTTRYQPIEICYATLWKSSFQVLTL